ncbi:Unknown protein [Striga hermonthica]|uniref:Uncharacterized protein n=1 Tax=Striga hermonthica TaxID=68872 RepID=A0A9N7RBA5_STRHE|nr:Unknown protein [Striga hermonthica]
MASTAAPNPCSLSRTNVSQRSNFSSTFSFKVPYFSDPRSPKLVSVQSHNPNLDSFKMEQTASGYGSGPDDSARLHASPSASAAIDFLTLCHRLKQ